MSDEETAIDSHDLDEEEDAEATLLNHKLYIKVHVSIFHDGGRFYSLGYEFGSRSGGTPCRTAEEVIDRIKNLLREQDFEKISADRIVLQNDTSIKINIPALVAQMSGNSLMGFMNTKVHSLSLDEEKIDPEIIKDHEAFLAADKFEHDVMDPMRDKISALESEAHKFGLPDRTGWSCWDKRAKKAALKKYPEAKELFDNLDNVRKEFEKMYDTKWAVLHRVDDE